MNIPSHLIEKSWEVYRSHSEGNGVEPDKLHYLCGFAAAIGVLIGSLDLGIPPGTLTHDVMAKLLHEISQYHAEIGNLEDLARRRSDRRNN
jgi:hypothetical protein